MRGGVGVRQEPGGAQAGATQLSRCAPDDRFFRGAAVARHRCGGDHHAGVDAFRAGQGGPGERQARVRRKAVHVDVGAGRGADRAGGAEEPAHHGGSHLPVQRRGPEDPRAGRQRHARPAVLLRLHPGEPRPVPARRQRAVGPGAARSVDHGSPDRRETGSGGGHRRQSPEPSRGHGVHHRVLSRATSSPTSTSTGCRRSRCGTR